MDATPLSYRKALIVGATGLIGDFCLQYLLDTHIYSEVIALTRKPLLRSHRKLKSVITNFRDIEQILSKTKAEDICCCLGSTIRKAGSQQAFKKVDYELVVSIAKLMKRQGAEQFIVISALGANRNSKFFYNRVKGEMEQAVEALDYPCLHIIRPSLLLGSREEFRLGEKIGGSAALILNPLLRGPLKKYRPIHAESVAQVMVKAAYEMPLRGVHVYESDMIQAFEQK